MRLQTVVADYYAQVTGEHSDHRSWEHCFRYFQAFSRRPTNEGRDQAALQLGFFLASWGMYRGSAFIRQYSYTANFGAVDALLLPEFSILWERDFGSEDADFELVPLILCLSDAIRSSYQIFAEQAGSSGASDTLVSKVLLGTLGCLPAYDRYFAAGFKAAGFRGSEFNSVSVHKILIFCQLHRDALRRSQSVIERQSGLRYPFMKLADMYFWQLGWELERTKASEFAKLRLSVG